jgi:putative hydrolase of the HAD superfamily
VAVALETVFLDAGGVLVYPNWTRISEALERHGVLVDADRLAAAEPHAKRQMDVAETIRATNDNSRGWLYFDLMLTEAGVALSDATAAALAELREFHSRQNLWEHVPDRVRPVLEALRARGLRSTIVSNANGTLCAHLERIGLARLVDCVLDSADVGIEKPDPRFFELALERAGARRDTTIHVGDLYHIDVVGARAAGIRAVLLDEAGLYEDADCPRVRSLTELLSAIENGDFD